MALEPPPLFDVPTEGYAGAAKRDDRLFAGRERERNGSVTMHSSSLLGRSRGTTYLRTTRPDQRNQSIK